MTASAQRKLYRKVQEKQLDIGHACEVGVYLPETSNVLDFIEEGVPTTLVEPDPRALKAIRKRFGHYEHVTLHPCAVHDHEGTVTLSQADASTFVSDLPSSPALVNDGYQISEEQQIEVACKRFSKIDDGSIDLLSIDTEGCEWYVLKHLQSEPKVISLETHGKFYLNPYLYQIRRWIAENGYRVWYRDKSDTVYLKEGEAVLSWQEQTHLYWMNVYLRVRRWKKVFYGV
jgi:FkbM family methyltransferase